MCVYTCICMHEDHWPVSQIREYQVNELVPACLYYLFNGYV